MRVPVQSCPTSSLPLAWPVQAIEQLESYSRTLQQLQPGQAQQAAGGGPQLQQPEGSSIAALSKMQSRMQQLHLMMDRAAQAAAAARPGLAAAGAGGVGERVELGCLGRSQGSLRHANGAIRGDAGTKCRTREHAPQGTTRGLPAWCPHLQTCFSASFS
jgi:hypothetical protein